MKKQMLYLMFFALLFVVVGANAAQNYKEPCTDTPNRVMCMLKNVDVNDVMSQELIATQIRIFAKANPSDQKLIRLEEAFANKYNISVDDYLKTSSDSKKTYWIFGGGAAGIATIALVGSAVLIPAALLGLYVIKRYRGRVAAAGMAAIDMPFEGNDIGVGYNPIDDQQNLPAVEVNAEGAGHGNLQRELNWLHQNAIDFLAQGHGVQELLALLRRIGANGNAAAVAAGLRR